MCNQVPIRFHPQNRFCEGACAIRSGSILRIGSVRGHVQSGSILRIGSVKGHVQSDQVPSSE